MEYAMNFSFITMSKLDGAKEKASGREKLMINIVKSIEGRTDLNENSSSGEHRDLRYIVRNRRLKQNIAHKH